MLFQGFTSQPGFNIQTERAIIAHHNGASSKLVQNHCPAPPGASPPHTVLPSAHHYKDAVVMPDQPFIDRLMADISRRLPTDLGGLRSEVERNVRSVLAETVSRLDLITREEFDIQQQVLLRTREKLEALEKQVAELEKSADA